jgi:hypothetical protein
MPSDNLWKLLEAFDTTDDPVLALKRTSVKRGIKGVIALAQSHGEEVDCEKVGSSHARPLSEMEEFFQKVKQYTPKSLTTPSSAPAANASAPSTAWEPAAEVV